MPEHYTVSLGDRSYPIHFGRDLRAFVRAMLDEARTQGRKAVVVTDQNLVLHQADALQAMMGDTPRLALPPGEPTKSLLELGRVLDFMAEQRLDRGGVLVAVGGGVIGDLGGFAAASYLRGISYWQVPASLLAMVDSSVGGKTGINLKAGKNLVGAFHQPSQVFISTDLLATLPAREFAAGMAEVIKYGLLGDSDLFEQLERVPLRVGSSRLEAVIRRCCEAKAVVVAADEFERAREGGRALLNLGHTFGHAIEQATAYSTYLHGEAVAIGMVAAARLSRLLGFINEADVARVEVALAAHALPISLQSPLPLTTLVSAMGRDKKVRAGKLRFVVLKRLGEAATRDDIDPALAEVAFREVGAE